jgi:hypothetical protein
VALPNSSLLWHLRWVLSDSISCPEGFSVTSVSCPEGFSVNSISCLEGFSANFVSCPDGSSPEPDGCSAARGRSCKIIQVVRYRIHITKFM